MNSFNSSICTVTGILGSYAIAMQEPGAPELNIRHTGQEVIISWLKGDMSFSLEMSASMSEPMDWQTVDDGATNEIALPAPAGTRYYRLVRRKKRRGDATLL